MALGAIDMFSDFRHDSDSAKERHDLAGASLVDGDVITSIINNRYTEP